MQQIVNQVEKYDSPPSLIINFDQTPSKYVPLQWQNKALQPYPFQGLTTKGHSNFCHNPERKILADAVDLQCQNKSKPKIEFPKEFSLSVNEKDYSNEEKSLKLLSEFVIRNTIHRERTPEFGFARNTKSVVNL